MPEIQELLESHRNRGVLLDSNLLLLLFMGGFNPAWIGSYKRLQKYTLGEFELVARLTQFFGRVITTPNILTEVSNLSGQMGEPARSAAYEYWKTALEILDERYVPGSSAITDSLFGKLGLTDAGIGLLAQAKFLVLTEDFPLSQRLSSMGCDAINFNHIRYFAWNS